MKTNRNNLIAWIVLGCIVFAGVGMQLASDAMGNVEDFPVTVRGQSPGDDASGVIVIDIDEETRPGMTRSQINNLILYLAIFMLAIFVGFEVITKVPPTLHTPLMSGSNAISGITLVGAIVVAGAGWGPSSLLGMVAVALAMINVVGGFLVTHRMLAMFQAKKR